MSDKNSNEQKSLAKRIFDIFGYTFLILIFAIGTGCAIYNLYLFHKLHKGTISVSEKKHLDEFRESARLYWSN